MSLGVLLLRKVIPFVPPLANRNLPRILHDGAPVPYGVAIAAGFLMMIWTGKVQG
jgi:Flp pilus assembly protein protease CpaA